MSYLCLYINQWGSNMNFTYIAENYYQAEGRLYVVYTPEDTALLPMGAWVFLESDMDAQGIADVIGEGLGLEWGGSWGGFVDKPHMQVTHGKSIQQLWGLAQNHA